MIKEVSTKKRREQRYGCILQSQPYALKFEEKKLQKKSMVKSKALKNRRVSFFLSLESVDQFLKSAPSSPKFLSQLQILTRKNNPNPNPNPDPESRS